MALVVVAGSFTQDMVFTTSTLPAAGETRIARFSTGPGGKGSNQAVACRRLGASTLFIGAVGDDPGGRSFAELVRREDIETALEVRSDAPTGAAGIIVDASSQNLIAVALGASGELSTEHVEAQGSRIAAARVLLVQLEANLDAVRRAMELARAAKVTTLLNPAPIHPGVSTGLLALADILTPNETELTYLLDRLHGVALPSRFWERPDAEVAGWCRLLGPATVIVTLGEHGAFVAPPTGAPRRLRAIAARPVDTTGAGDAFSGALAAGLALHRGSLDQALRLAVVAAGLSTERAGAARAGAALAMPTAAEVAAAMDRGDPG